MTRYLSYAGLIVALTVSHAVGAAADKDHPLVNSLGMRFVSVSIPGGKPVMFSVWKTRVKDFDAFATDAHYDATKDMYSMTPAGRGDRNVANWKAPGFAQTDLFPVCGVSYADAVAFCAWLSKKETRHYRLPTDHEWSCAVGIGDKERASDGPRGNHRKVDGVYPWGTQWPPPKGAGNYAGEECRGVPTLPKNYGVIPGYRDGFVFTSPVGSFDANSLGLYDLGGNLWEWCDDWMDSDHRHRVLRGGSWGDDAAIALLASYRRHELPTDRGVVFGFRVVLEE
ncbi:MAG TPA: SUMF1/EgtB/PvdO family nonheme iron enzyme [Tepidisphaeraceae bacterium]|jgi:formylglycine-generating enzyme required for sulfatase activity|nr:SUMF1/EgtB/PvdO family nonheme iron enzyme [Tepidisphaeraceae bacterium]